MSIDFSRLLPLGWSNFFSTQIPLEALERVRPARAVRVERERYGVDAGEGEFFATLAGRYRHEHEGGGAANGGRLGAAGGARGGAAGGGGQYSVRASCLALPPPSMESFTPRPLIQRFQMAASKGFN
jgi:hypothetical protein